MGEPAVLCMLCGSPRKKILHRGDEDVVLRPEDFSVTKSRIKKGEVSRCLVCGLVYNTSPRPDPGLYAGVCDPEYESGKACREKEFVEAFDLAKPFLDDNISPLCFLDIGCMTGIFLEHLKAKYPGAMVSGVEPSVWASEICREKKLDVLCGRFEDMELGSNRYDAVTLFDVLEHVEDPRRFLKRIHAALKPGGVLLLTTPNIESLFSRLLGRRYWFIEHMHLYYFGPVTIRKLLQDTGFEPILRKRHFKYLGSRYFVERLRGLGFLPAKNPEAEIKRPGRERVFKIYAGQMLILARKLR